MDAMLHFAVIVIARASLLYVNKIFCLFLFLCFKPILHKYKLHIMWVKLHKNDVKLQLKV